MEMILHYLTMAIRNLSRNKVFSLINILGLAVGLGICLLIYQYIHFELSFDRFHPNASNVYRLTQTIISNEGTNKYVYLPYALGPRGKENIPEIKQFVRIRPWSLAPVISNPLTNRVHQENGVWSVDSHFLQMFDFPLKYGDRGSALDDMYSVVITEEMANKYFGSAIPLGKTLKVSLGMTSGNFIVSGVLETPPANSHLEFDFLLPLTFLLESHTFYKEFDSEGWELADFVTYFELENSAIPVQVGEKFDRMIGSYQGEELATANMSIKTVFQPITEIHLRSDYSADLAKNNGDIRNIQYFSIIAIFILIIAWVNYINLSTARAIHRAKEVGVRKSIGANRKQLIGQFMMESFLINLIAVVPAIGLAFLLLPALNDIIGKELTLSVLQNMEFWGWFLVVITAGALLSGLYPAFVLSAYKPVSVLKSVKVTRTGGLSLRRGLIVFQFFTSALLIAGTYLVYKQITFMKTKDLGVDMEQILILNGPRVFLETLESEGVTMGTKYQTFKNKVANHHSISAISATSSVPAKGYYYTEGFRKSGEQVEANKTGSIVIVDTDFTDTYGMEFLAAVPYPKEISPDRWGIINEEAVEVFGLGSPEEAIHEKLTNNFGDTLEVVGVIKNTHWNSLRNAHAPILFFLNNDWGAYFSIRMDLSNIQETIAHIKSVYDTVFPTDPFEYFFLDDQFNRQYQSDMQFSKLFTAFSVLAIFIACLGLFALVLFSSALRVKEIGIRKVFGASVGNLMVLLSKEYMILLIVANVLAIPAIAWGGRAWLDNYAFRIGMDVELFLIPFMVLIIISFLTVSYHTYATARANPVDSLRME